MLRHACTRRAHLLNHVLTMWSNNHVIMIYIYNKVKYMVTFFGYLVKQSRYNIMRVQLCACVRACRWWERGREGKFWIRRGEILDAERGNSVSLLSPSACVRATSPPPHSLYPSLPPSPTCLPLHPPSLRLFLFPLSLSASLTRACALARTHLLHGVGGEAVDDPPLLLLLRRAIYIYIYII
jgi:hypothetical protein